MQFHEKIQPDYNVNAKGTSHLSTYLVIHTHHEQLVPILVLLHKNKTQAY